LRPQLAQSELFWDTGQPMDRRALSRLRLGFSVVTGSLCPDCGHVWMDHPGALISVTHCADCNIEEDHGDRDDADMCSRVPPDLEHVPVGDSLVARYRRRRLRGDRVLVEDHTGGRWAVLKPRAAGPQEVERLLLEVRADLAIMPITQFREKYRQLME
jgi:hypothetical protein